MIRSARIPDILSRVIADKDPVIQTVMLVTADGELLGSTSSTYTNNSLTASTPSSTSMNSSGHFTNPSLGAVDNNGNTNTMSIEHLGALIADIAVDYQQLGDVMNSNHSSSGLSNNTTSTAVATTTTTTPGSSNNNNNDSSSNKSPKPNKKSTTLLLELEQGLVGVASCLDCWIIAIAATPNAPMGMIQARLQTIAEYVQEGLSPLTETVMDR